MSEFYFPSDTYYGIPVLKDDSAEVAQKFDRLSNVLRQNQADSDQQRMAQMAAERLGQYGEQGAYWGEQIKKDPRAAMMMAEQYGGFGEIEAQLAAARAQGASRDAMERALQASGGAGLSPAELEIFRQGGPDELKKFRDAMNPTADGPTSYRTEEGVYIRDPKAPGGYRRVGPAPKGELITFGESGLKPTEEIAAEDRAAGRVDERVKPLENSLDAYEAFLEVYEKVMARDGIPTVSESDTLAKLASRTETGEAVNDSDVARKSGGGFMNAARTKGGIGILMSPETVREVAETTAAVAAARKRTLERIRREAKEVAEGRGLNPNAVAPGARVDRPVPEDVPPGSTYDETLDVWVSPDGRYFAED